MHIAWAKLLRGSWAFYKDELNVTFTKVFIQFYTKIPWLKNVLKQSKEGKRVVFFFLGKAVERYLYICILYFMNKNEAGCRYAQGVEERHDMFGFCFSFYH